MNNDTTDKSSLENIPRNVSGNNSTDEPITFEKLIEDSFYDSDLEDESLPKNNPEITGSGYNNQPDETSAIARTTHEIMEIIAQNELIEKAKRDRIKSLIEKQEKILQKKEEELGKLEGNLDLINKKRKLAKKALKKAKVLKLSSDKISLIKLDVKQTSESRKSCKSQVEQETTDIRNMKILIELLETTL